MANIEDVENASLLFAEQASAPATPTTGLWRLYPKADGFYYVDDTGAEVGPLAASGLSSLSGVRVYKSTDQSISNATFTAVTFDTELEDTDSYHDNATNPSRFTVPADGRYLVEATMSWTSATGGERQMRIYKNATAPYGATGLLRRSNVPGGIVNHTTQTYLLSLAAGDYFELIVYQSGGSAQNLSGGDEYETSLSAFRIGS